MSSLTEIETRYLERLLGMGGGYVLDYSDATYAAFFGRFRIDIHGPKYQTYGTSKAKKMRAFWEVEPDAVVGRVLSEMLAAYEADCEINKKPVNSALLDKSRAIVARLCGKPQPGKVPASSDGDFLTREFTIPNVQRLPVEAQALPIIESRLVEARKALSAGAHLSVIFLCGRVLEAVLLGAAQKEPARFNSASASPKAKDSSVKQFHQWSLAEFIDVACELDILKPDVKKFSHGLRDFRNYIHPYEQMVSGFTPDEHTAKVCFQVLKAALATGFERVDDLVGVLHLDDRPLGDLWLVADLAHALDGEPLFHAGSDHLVQQLRDHLVADGRHANLSRASPAARPGCGPARS